MESTTIAWKQSLTAKEREVYDAVAEALDHYDQLGEGSAGGLVAVMEQYAWLTIEDPEPLDVAWDIQRAELTVLARAPPPILLALRDVLQVVPAGSAAEWIHNMRAERRGREAALARVREEQARSALRRVLHRRKLVPTTDHEAQIDGADLPDLERWLDQAVHAESVGEALGPRAPEALASGHVEPGCSPPCPCGRVLCGGVDLAERVSRGAQDAAPETVALARWLSRTYAVAAEAQAEHGRMEPLLVGGGWFAVAQQIEAGERPDLPEPLTLPEAVR